MAGLLEILAPKGKALPTPSSSAEAAPDSEPAEKSSDDYVALMFDALKADDRNAFAAALKGAMRTCSDDDDT